ncbi:MAG: tetratricopeptide repeat protein, partial [Acidobacteriota bacterium]
AAVAALTVAAGLWLGGRPPAPAEAARERPGLSPIFAARDAYERGQVAMARRSEDGLRSSVTQFARAVALSPHYAEAYVGLADALSLLSSYGLVDPREAMPRARDAANRALAIDPSLAQAHASLGRTAMIFDWDWRTAEFHLAKARALAPGDGRVHQWSAYLLAALGRFEEAEAEARRAVAAEPLSPNTNTALGFVLYLTRQFEAAEIQLRRTIEMDPDFLQARRALALVAVQTRRLPEATAELERVARVNRESPAARADLAWIYGLSGRQDEARRLIAELEQTASRSFVPPDGLAQASLGIGDIDAALSWIDRALATRVATLANLAVDPMWDPMRGQPRFAAALETIGRPSRQAER